jgi:hypothetical protein
LALLVVPVTDRAQKAAGRRAKLVTGCAYVGGFTVVFVAVRLYLADFCETAECYTGAQPQPGLTALRTGLYNLFTAIPGAAGNEVLADLDRVGWADRYPVQATPWSVAVGVTAIAVLVVAWRATRPAGHIGDEPLGSGPADSRAEAILLSVAAALSLLVAISTAAVMGISVQAQQIITEPGMPYRNTMVTWFALAFALVLLVRAGSLLLPSRGGVIAWTTLAVLIGALAALTLPSNLMVLRAYRVNPGLAVTEKINWEVVLGDATESSDSRRCLLFDQLEHSMSDEWTRNRIYSHANGAFWHYHGQPFCSDSAYPGSSVPAG